MSYHQSGAAFRLSLSAPSIRAPENMAPAVRCFHLTQTIFNDFLMHTSRCGLTRHYESLADKANGTKVVNGLAVLPVINDA